MSRHVVIGTAGHVDHGKTALVAKLTGVDTDRWAEEKRRGITIDLGFAPLALGEGLTASIVDVPGHEDFVRNMVAGATGVDVALLVVAADEGVMPQTSEHLAILEFLGVRTGVVALTKIDLAEPEWLELVQADLAERLAGSSIAWQPPVRCSAVSGVGVEQVVAALAAASVGAVERAADDVFRMPVDRVFPVAGAGTVVTGTTWSGAVAVGDSVQVLPAGGTARVRSVEVHGQARERAEPGRRTALALPGVDRADVRRGSVVVAGSGWQEHAALDVLLTLLPEARPLTQRSRVRVHLGTAEVLARVTPAAGDILPGTTAPARLRLETPLVARWGDRAILRSYSPVHTIGGCRVIDPLPPSRPRRPTTHDERASAEPVQRAAAFAEAAGVFGLDLATLPIRIGVRSAEVGSVAEAAVAAGVAVVVGDRLVPPRLVAEATGTALDDIAAHHAAHPTEPGPSREHVRLAVGSPELADYVTEQLAETGRVVLEGGTLRLASHRPGLTGSQEHVAAELRAALETAAFEGLTLRDLADAGGREEAQLLAEFLVRQGEVVKVGRDRYYLTGAFERLRSIIVSEVAARQGATPAELRDVTGLTRKYLIPVLEWLDGAGYTVRDGDVRRIGPAAQQDPGDA